ncbi:hypothetical protein HGP17_32265 [Rhizobium sp. P38BS-XIX]|uniref:hypothetical protein n=1 Tax=Rhizobium sp. P38BS-XIX TaxID=2726740 RepID=UPI0014570BC2|nr:hypothetical protein [Rhizobium sp. P38BS-XIX]NLS01533.1 hypothetical protein [Rhizobium sp. P38BS-XIX]
MMIGRTGLLSGGAIERFAANTDDMDYPRGGIVDVSAVAMIYADGPLTHTGNVAQSSLHTQQRLSQ